VILPQPLIIQFLKIIKIARFTLAMLGQRDPVRALIFLRLIELQIPTLASREFLLTFVTHRKSLVSDSEIFPSG
jgi:hypothetical protein